MKFLRSSKSFLYSFSHWISLISLSLYTHTLFKTPSGQIQAEEQTHRVDAQTRLCVVSHCDRARLVEGLPRSHVGVLRNRRRNAAWLAPARGGQAGRPAPPALRPLSLAPGGRLIHQLELLMLLFQEEVHQQALFFLDLVTDVCGDVWDHPVHEDTQEHHKVLPQAREED